MATADTPSQENRTLGERRGPDRRRLERRAPPPLWRRPWAFVAYGAAAGAAVVLATSLGRSGAGAGDDPPIVQEPSAPVTPAPATPAQPSPTPGGRVEAAHGAAGFERLTLEGAGAVGRRVRTELYCEQPRSYQVREGVQPEPVVAALASNGRVPAAECKWGGPSDPRREDFVLMVPPELAAEFASAPVVSDQFQRRRRLSAEVEWIGRSEALALRAAGVFRGLTR